MSRQRVLVVGGGIAGVSAADRLAADNDVILVESRAELGTQATGRSAAILSETSGTRVMCALAGASRDFLEQPPRGFTDSPLTASRGLLWIGQHGDEEKLESIASGAVDVSPSTVRVDGVSAMALVTALRPGAVSAGGVYEPDARSLDVDLLLRSYAREARQRGAEMRLNVALVSAARTGRCWDVRTTGGDIVVDTLVNAAGAWADDVAQRCGIVPLKLTPLRRSACLVRTDRDVEGWPLVMDVANRCYFEPGAGGLLLSPADEHLSPPVDAQPDEIDIAWGIEVVNELTDLSIRSVRTAWAGLRTFTSDRDPAVGRDVDDPSFIWFVGQGGAGIKTAPAMADALAAAMGVADWPTGLARFGVHPEDLDPIRLR